MLFMGGFRDFVTDPKGTLKKIADAASKVFDSLIPPPQGAESDLRFAGLPSSDRHGLELPNELLSIDPSSPDKKSRSTRSTKTVAARLKALNEEFEEKVKGELGARVINAIGEEGLALLKAWEPDKSAARTVTYELLKAMNPTQMKDGLTKLMNYPGQYTDLIAIMRWASKGTNSLNPFTAAKEILTRPPTEEQVAELRQQSPDKGTAALGKSLSGHLLFDHTNFRFLSFENRPDLGVTMAGMDLLRSFFQVFNPERTEFAPQTETAHAKKRERSLDDVIREIQKLEREENGLAETDPDKFVGRKLVDREREMVRALSQLVNNLTNEVGDATRGSTFFNHVHDSMSVGTDPGGQLFGYFKRLIEEDPTSVSEHIKEALAKLQDSQSKLTRREEDLLYRSLIAESLRRTGISKDLAVNWLTSCVNAYEHLPENDAIRIKYGPASRLHSTIDHLKNHTGDAIPVQVFRASWETFPVEAICAQINTRYLEANPLFNTYVARFKPYFIDDARGWHSEIEGSSVPMALLEKGLDGRRIGLPIGGTTTRTTETNGEPTPEARVPTLRQPDWEQIMRALEFRTYHPDDARFVRGLTPHTFKAMVDGVIIAGRRADARDKEFARAGIDLSTKLGEGSSITNIGTCLDDAEISLLSGMNYIRSEQSIIHLSSGASLTAAHVYDVISDRTLVYAPSKKESQVMAALAAGLVPETVEAHKLIRSLAEHVASFVPVSAIQAEIEFAQSLAQSPWAWFPLRDRGLPQGKRYVDEPTAETLKKVYLFKPVFEKEGLSTLVAPNQLPKVLVNQTERSPVYVGYSAESAPLFGASRTLRSVLKCLESNEILRASVTADHAFSLDPIPAEEKKVAWVRHQESGVFYSPNIRRVLELVSSLNTQFTSAIEIDPLTLKKMKFLFSPEGAEALSALNLKLPTEQTNARVAVLSPHRDSVWVPRKIVERVNQLPLSDLPPGKSGLRLSAPVESWIGNSPHFVWQRIDGVRTPVLNFTKSDKLGLSMVEIAQFPDRTDFYTWLARKEGAFGWTTLSEIAKLGQRLVAHFRGAIVGLVPLFHPKILSFGSKKSPSNLTMAS